MDDMSETQKKPCVVKFDGIETVELAGGLWWDLIVPKTVFNEHIAICMVKFEPGRWLYRHCHTVEECYFVMKGKLLVELDEEVKEVPEKSAVYIPPGVNHRFKCSSDYPVTVLVVLADKDWLYEGPYINSRKLDDHRSTSTYNE